MLKRLNDKVISMTYDTNLDVAKQEQFLELIHESLRVQSHFDLFILLQGRMQTFLPHQIMIAAWGDFSLGQVYFDIVSSLSGLRTSDMLQNNMLPLLKRLFRHWDNHNRVPLVLNVAQGLFEGDELEYDYSNGNFNNMKSAVIHGIKDCRGQHDCLYVLMNTSPMQPPSRKLLAALMPYIDCSLRQLDHLPEQLPEEDPATKDQPEDAVNAILSAREKDIMEWVQQGKTNVEIGMILDISAFTVKNHLQRIFKKLDVLNRAQAVSRYK